MTSSKLPEIPSGWAGLHELWLRIRLQACSSDSARPAQPCRTLSNT